VSGLTDEVRRERRRRLQSALVRLSTTEKEIARLARKLENARVRLIGAQIEVDELTQVVPDRLTDRQYQIVKLVWEYRRSRGVSPSYAEIGKFLGIDVNAVLGHINKLEKKGAITRIPRKHRSLRLTKDMEKTLNDSVG